jgi:ribosome-associated protein
LIDYGDFVVHIFSSDDRSYYALEEIWGDAPQLDWQERPTGAREPAAAPEDQPPRAADRRDE